LATTSAIFTRNGTDVAHVVGFLTKSSMPVTRLIVSPIATTGKTQPKAERGTWRLIPSTRRSSTQLAPTSTAMPMVWSVSTVGSAQTDGDSRSQTASEDDSIQFSTRQCRIQHSEFRQHLVRSPVIVNCIVDQLACDVITLSLSSRH